MANIFISYTQKEPDYSLAKHFYNALKSSHTPFLASESIRIGETWPERIQKELVKSDYFLVFLSEQSLQSDMVTEEVRKARELQQQSGNKPVILPIRVNLPFNADTNYDLSGYLNKIHQKEWNSEADTSSLLNEILSVINQNACVDFQEETEIQVRTPQLQDMPLPNAPLELPEGQVRIDSPFYIERESDSNCMDEVLRPGSLVRIYAPRQFGKTSLLSRVIQHANTNDHHIISLSLQLLDEACICNLEAFLKQLCLIIARKLKLAPNMEEYWIEYESVKMRCSTYIEEYILTEIDKPIVLALDEADRLFAYKSVSDDFFGLLRYWHEQAKISPIWEKLKLIVVHSTEPYLGVSNINQSPFYNVGYEAKLVEFNKTDISHLATQHDLRLNDNDIAKLISLLGGHPYLIRRALYELANSKMTLDELLETAPTNEGIFGDHLRRNLLNLGINPELAHAMSEIAKQNYYKDAFICYRLQAAGLIKGEFPDVRPRCELYTRYFQNRL